MQSLFCTKTQYTFVNVQKKTGKYDIMKIAEQPIQISAMKQDLYKKG